MRHDISFCGNPRFHEHKYHEPMRNSKEVAEEFGFVSSNSLRASVRSKSFPEPDFVAPSSSVGQGRKLYWKLSTLKKEKARRVK